jgi:hypothetical protein
MSDMMMCPGEGCPRKGKCYRYCAIPDPHQSYFTVAPHDNDECEYFWPKRGRERTRERESDELI